jgi:hypothetical protein
MDSGASAQRVGLRAFYPEAGLLLFDRQPLDLFALDTDMISLRNNARVAQQHLLDELTGRFGFGGGQLIKLEATARIDARQMWETKRAEARAGLASEVDLGAVRMWMQIEDQI